MDNKFDHLLLVRTTSRISHGSRNATNFSLTHFPRSKCLRLQEEWSRESEASSTVELFMIDVRLSSLIIGRNPNQNHRIMDLCL